MFIFPYSVITVSSVKLLLFLNRWKKNSLLRNLKQMTAMKTLIKYTKKESTEQKSKKPNSKNSSDLNEVKTLKNIKGKNIKSYGVFEETSGKNSKLNSSFKSFNSKKKGLNEDKRASVIEYKLTNMVIKINSLNVGLLKRNKMRRKASQIVLLIVLLFLIQWYLIIFDK